jgi:DNA-binding response OmpR family regulator
MPDSSESNAPADVTRPAGSGGPEQPTAILVGQRILELKLVAAACDAAGLRVDHVTDPQEAGRRAADLQCRLVVAAYGEALASHEQLLAARQAGKARAVMFGPAFGSLQHVLALELGFDEVWPQSTGEMALHALVRAALRQNRGHAALDGAAGLASLRVDPESLRCEFAGQTLALTPSQIRIFGHLVNAHPSPVSRVDLMRYAKPSRRALDGGSRSVDAQVSRIRTVLADGGLTSLTIESVQGFGYRLVRSPEPGR